ncbi:hypothetical protein BDZ90DRAFT_9039 [Jaminaea rosea]|uniref:Uncharacterized protein n=1 Tax=Jaminaea rosea TaxID=1569628 RepID=A0A316UYB0_9BASI|nr:hypothetical protein BDZ90DRAFT_9039 [Jaminaea rosea]PWN30289.1 hypothetical protein BDZ90DRAFT_9039 [Jaminaea rosea]
MILQRRNLARCSIWYFVRRFLELRGPAAWGTASLLQADVKKEVIAKGRRQVPQPNLKSRDVVKWDEGASSESLQRKVHPGDQLNAGRPDRVTATKPRNRWRSKEDRWLRRRRLPPISHLLDHLTLQFSQPSPPESSPTEIQRVDRRGRHRSH